MIEANNKGISSTEAFEKLLGSNTYGKPLQAEEGINMSTVVAKVGEKLAEDKPCIASMGYAYAAKIMWTHDCPIAINKEQVK